MFSAIDTGWERNMNDTQQFYDGMAESYHFLFADWEKSVQRQAQIIYTFLSALGESEPKTILDCTCGIGTQAIGLAMKGYRVHGTDLSPRAIEQAQQNAAQFATRYPITFEVADLLKPIEHPTEYDVVLAFDNPMAHFHTEDDLLQAFQSMSLQCKEGGLITTSLRDYDALVQEKPRQSQVSITDSANGRRIMFQVWDWLDDTSGYQSEMFIIKQDGKQWQTESYISQMRAWQRDEMTEIMRKAGLIDIQWHMPDESGYYQPIVTART